MQNEKPKLVRCVAEITFKERQDFNINALKAGYRPMQALAELIKRFNRGEICINRETGESSSPLSGD